MSITFLTKATTTAFLSALATVVVACSPQAPSFETLDVQVRPLPVPARLYSSVAWLRDDRIALAYLVPDSPDWGMTLVDDDGVELRELTPPDRPECRVRNFLGMARTADGGLGFADVCDAGPRDLVDFVTMDIDSGDLQGLGAGTPWPYEAAWADDGSIVYSTGDNLCATLYRHAEGDGPVDMEVEVDGQQFAAGQDVAVSPDGCPKGGRAGYPAYAANGRTLAFMASSDGDTPLGQELLDRPWTILVVRDGAPVSVLDGLGEPRGLIWTADGERLIFAARLHGRLGLWSIHPDGSRLTFISSMDAIHVAPDPAGNAVVAILSSKVLSDGEYADDNEVVIVDLPSH